jgi:NADH:ubiquinone oxidoreductase subunit 5 (subunit L)/multisubunit Na+/H+ antiporter MnhA subunit
MTSALLLQTCVLLLLGGALVSLACARNRALAGWVSVAFVAAACLPLARVVVNVFSGVAEGETVLLALPALAARLTVHVDALSAFFLVLTGVIAVLSTLFSVRYMEHFEKDTVAKFYPVLLVFFASMVALLVVTDM